MFLVSSVLLAKRAHCSISVSFPPSSNNSPCLSSWPIPSSSVQLASILFSLQLSPLGFEISHSTCSKSASTTFVPVWPHDLMNPFRNVGLYHYLLHPPLNFHCQYEHSPLALLICYSLRLVRSPALLGSCHLPCFLSTSVEKPKVASNRGLE